MFFRRIATMYDKALKTNPMMTKSFTCFGIFTITDITSQSLLKKIDTTSLKDDWKLSRKPKIPENKLDLIHSVKFGFLYGALWAGPVFHTFFNVVTPLPIPVRILLQCTVVDTANIAMCMALQTYMKGATVEETTKFVKDKFVAIYSCGMQVLPFSHCIVNFLVPLPYRVLYVTGQAYLWNTYLCASLSEDESVKDSLLTRVGQWKIDGYGELELL